MDALTGCTVEGYAAAPLLQIRTVAARYDETLAVQAQAAARRANLGTGQPMTVNALYNAERNGPEARTTTIAEWAEAWGFDVAIEVTAPVPTRFLLATLPDGITWKAMTAVLAAMGVSMQVQLVPRAKTG